MAAAAPPPLNPWIGDVSQWQITWQVGNVPPEVEIIRRFANAWGVAQPPPPDEEPGWTYTRRLDVWQALSEGHAVRVAWRQDTGAFVTLRRL